MSTLHWRRLRARAPNLLSRITGGAFRRASGTTQAAPASAGRHDASSRPAKNGRRTLASVVREHLPLAGFVSVFAALIVAALTLYSDTQRMARTAALVDSTHETIARLDEVALYAERVVTIGRVFVLSGEEDFLTPLVSLKQRIDEEFRLLWASLEDRPDEAALLESIETQARLRLALTDSYIELRRNHGLEATTAEIPPGGEQAATVLRARLDELKDAIRDRLAESRNMATASHNRTLQTLRLTGIASLIVLALAVAAWRRQSVSKRAAEKALSRSEARLREAQRIAGVGTWDWNIETNAFWWSDEMYRLLDVDGEESGDLRGALLQKVHTKDAHAVSEAVNGTLEDPSPWSLEHRVVLPDGSERTVHHQAQVIRNAGGRATHVIGTVHDVTERVAKQDALKKALREIGKLKERLEDENVLLREEIETARQFEHIVGESRALRQCLKTIEDVAPTDVSVLVMGETGTGKELIAQAIHDKSERKNRPMVTVNCAAIPAGLIESELFGHERGAFTDAGSMRKGRFEMANGGTLFLDEIGDLPLMLQSKLLRVIQEGVVERLGSNEPVEVDVRLIAATNKRLDLAVERGEFRPDLYFRINTFSIDVPPLRDRKEDIPLLAEHFIRKHAPRLGKEISAISEKTLRFLTEQDWPGNVRELENFMIQCVVLATGPVLSLPASIKRNRTVAEPGMQRSAETNLRIVERNHILHVLERCNWIIDGKSGAAAALGLKPSTLRSRMKRLDIRRDSAA